MVLQVENDICRGFALWSWSHFHRDVYKRQEPEIYGHFSEHLGRCIYEGIYVGEDSPIPNKNGMRTDVVEALKKIKVPVLRWPGGCFADEYHWMDGVGPKESRKQMINTNWGGVTEDNSFGTHEYFELCDQLGCKTYVLSLIHIYGIIFHIITSFRSDND